MIPEYSFPKNQLLGININIKQSFVENFKLRINLILCSRTFTGKININ